ncbi:serine/threonine-protein kinase SAPK7 [Carex littledalei]|uniref:Serine/threonine-protein kinase SAPK7 n=1 Tax=Carex littledalei TaxID=544730 RepID=A0A833VGT7_9POAL|nr:serine/threonine-protein kinase SAPK7 [Carex littledalei]
MIKKRFMFRLQRILTVQSKIYRQLLACISVAKQAKRIKIQEIMNHLWLWFLKYLPRELTETAQGVYYTRDNTAPTHSLQTEEEIMQIWNEARKRPQIFTEGEKEVKPEQKSV